MQNEGKSQDTLILQDIETYCNVPIIKTAWFLCKSTEKNQ